MHCWPRFPTRDWRAEQHLGSGAVFRRAVAVYQNESLSPSCGEQIAPRLLLDCMLGRLARWLRLIGYDAAYENAAEDQELARRARFEGRVLLTRDFELASRRGLRTLLIGSKDLEEQVRQVLAVLPIAYSDRTPRCSQCNHPLNPVERAEVADRVPPYVLREHADFHLCSECGRVYWPGSHFECIWASIKRFGAEGGANE